MQIPYAGFSCRRSHYAQQLRMRMPRLCIGKGRQVIKTIVESVDVRDGLDTLIRPVPRLHTRGVLCWGEVDLLGGIMLPSLDIFFFFNLLL